MVGHVFFRSKMARILNDVYVATGDKQIADYIQSIGGTAIMTSDKHERASDRTTEALLKIEKATGQRIDIVVLIQGDEPMIYPQMIDEAVRPMLEDESILVVNLMAPLKNKEEHENPNEVKVIVDRDDFAMYFSPEPILSRKKGITEVPMLKQVCIIPFRRDFLIRFGQLEPTPLEIIESIDMLRVLEHGYKVKMVPINFNTYAVDTPEELAFVEKLMTDDTLVKKCVVFKSGD